VSMTGKIEHVEVITSVQRRRRWSAEEKAEIVQETYAPGMSVSLVARRHGIAPNQLFRWFEHYNPASSHPSLYAIEEKRFC
jgi:transposase